MNSINRSTVVIKLKQPFVDWLNSIPGESSDNKLENMPTEVTTFNVPVFSSPKELKAYIQKRYSLLFEFELYGWYTAEELWPKKRTWEMFQEWFSIEVNSEIFDLVNRDIEKEEM